MGKLPLPIIRLDKRGVFSQGNFVSGKVELTVDSEGLHNIKGIWVLFTCKAKVEFGPWTDRHEDENQYLNSFVTVFGAGKRTPAKPDLSLPPGDHSFPFKFRLPTDKDLPSPFEGDHGYVRYRARATLSIERKIINKESYVELPFKMRGPTVDLNRLRNNLKVPVSCSIDVRSLFGLGAKKGATVHFGLAKRAFVPGEQIVVTGSVDNVSGEEQRTIEVTLVKETTYTAFGLLTDSTQEDKDTLRRSSRKIGCPQGKTTKFKMSPLSIPTDSPSTDLPGCKLIDVQYSVRCNTSGCIETTFRLNVGTVTVRRVAGPVPTAVTAAEATEGALSASAPPMGKAKAAALSRTGPDFAGQALPTAPVSKAKAAALPRTGPDTAALPRTGPNFANEGSAYRADDAPPAYRDATSSRPTKDI